MHHNNDGRILTLGVLPIISHSLNIQRDVYSQTINLIANILCLTSNYTDYKLSRIIVYVVDHHFADKVLSQFQSAGLSCYITNCIVKLMGPDIHVSADISMQYWFQSKL